MSVSLVANHCTTWHDGGVAVLHSDGSVTALAAERVGDRFKHSWNSRLAYDYLLNRYKRDSQTLDLFIDCSSSLSLENHHLYHAESAFFQSGFDDSAVLVLDGQGPGHNHLCTATIWSATTAGIELVDEVLSGHQPFADQSLGHFYTAVTALCGFKGLNTEGSAMALAALGKQSAFLPYFEQFMAIGDEEVIINPKLTRSILGHTYGPEYYGWEPPGASEKGIWRDLQALRESGGTWPTQDDMNIAWAGQTILEKATEALVRRTKRIVGGDRICLAGGVALNCVSNGKIARAGHFFDVFVASAPGDDGQALGRLVHEAHARDLMVARTGSPYLGPVYTADEVRAAVSKLGSRYPAHALSDGQIAELVAAKLSKGRIVGWARGRSELGPRALGNRSLLADPRDPSIRARLNEVKKREYFRPVAPAIKVERQAKYFEGATESYYMSFASNARELALVELPGAIHTDGSARLQTVSRESNSKLYELLDQYEGLTSVPAIVNTSFNGPLQPIVETPLDAVNAAIGLGIDDLALDGWLIELRT